jgi:hypothetical protein
MDPVIQAATSPPPQDKTGTNPARMSTFRRDIWPSRAMMEVGSRKNKFYQTWDERVLVRWFKYGFRDLPTAIYPEEPKTEENPVTLSTTKHQEVHTFLRPNYDGLNPNGERRIDRIKAPDANLDAPISNFAPFYRPEPASVLRELRHVRPTVLYIFGGDSYLSEPPARKLKMDMTGIGTGGSGGAKEGKVKEVVLTGIGHLVAMEAVQQCADAAGEWIGSQLSTWREQDNLYREARSKKSRIQILTVDDEWKEKIGGDFRAKPKM